MEQLKRLTFNYFWMKMLLLICLTFCFMPVLSNFGKSKESVLSSRVQKLSEWSMRRPVIRMDSEKFRQYVKTGPKNYSVILQLTALKAQRQCQVCSQANEEFTILANSWRYSSMHNNRLFFASVDFDEGMDVFSSLNLNTAPVFMHFPAKGKPKKADTMDIQRVGFSAETIARWVTERADLQIRVFRPPNYSGTLMLILMVALIGILLYFKRDNLEFLYNRTAWGILSLSIMFCMISGQMWNHIRSPPFVHRNPQTGQMSYIHGGNGFQLITESYIVIVLNVAVVVGVILLNEANNIKGDTGKKRIFSLAGIAMVCIFFSLLLSVFRTKYQGYPYSFLFK